jgi:hypothetical protein
MDKTALVIKKTCGIINLDMTLTINLPGGGTTLCNYVVFNHIP